MSEIILKCVQNGNSINKIYLWWKYFTFCNILKTLNNIWGKKVVKTVEIWMNGGLCFIWHFKVPVESVGELNPKT